MDPRGLPSDHLRLSGTLHLSSQKWLKGFLGTAKWNTFAYEASDLFASYYGGILSSAARRWTAEAVLIGEARPATLVALCLGVFGLPVWFAFVVGSPLYCFAFYFAFL